MCSVVIHQCDAQCQRVKMKPGSAGVPAAPPYFYYSFLAPLIFTISPPMLITHPWGHFWRWVSFLGLGSAAGCCGVPAVWCSHLLSIKPCGQCEDLICLWLFVFLCCWNVCLGLVAFLFSRAASHCSCKLLCSSVVYQKTTTKDQKTHHASNMIF